MKTIRDAVHGDMHFDAIELAVIDTPALQRLRGVKQLGASNLVYPAAVHTRFEHSLGTCHLTHKLLNSLEGAGHAITPEERRVATLAALLHDVTHVPFGHTFEDERRLFERHDQDAQRLDHFLSEPNLAQALEQSGARDAVRSLLVADKATPRFLRDIITGAVCADLLDYLKRDAYFCGLRLDYDDRLLQCFALSGGELVFRLHKGGAFRGDALSELVHLLQIRYTLTERVYFHHAKVVAGAMISRAVELAMEAGVLSRDELFDLRDDSLLDRLIQRAAEVSGLSDLLADLASRRLYRRAYFLTVAGLGREGLAPVERDALARDFHFDVGKRRQIEQFLADRLGTPEAHVIVYCPSPAMSLKEADVPVEAGPGRREPLSALGHPDVTALAEKHRGLWRFYVCVRRDESDLARRAGELAEELIGFPNQLGSQSEGKLAFRQ